MKAARADEWTELLKSDELNPWTRVKLQECGHETKQDDDQAKEHRAAGHAEEHGLLEADHHASGRTGRGHIVGRVPTLPPISA